MVREAKRPLKVFLCHASGDKPPVRDLYKRLTAEGVDAWLDKEKLLPGQDWRLEIPRAVQEADVVVVCLSNKSVTKEGYVQKEIKFALDSAEEKPEGAIFLIPARLEDCVVPERLSRWQWVDLYEENGFIQLLRSLKLRADAVGATVEPTSYVDSDKETERRLDQLYTEGLAAFYTEDWDRACQRFQSILSERPSHKSAAEKLGEAERQRGLAKLYEQAMGAVQSEDWQRAIKILEELSQKTADYKDVVPLLKNARKQKQLGELYAEAGKLHAAQKWQAVVKVFEQISAIEPNFPDVNGLLPSAQKEVTEIKRLEELNSLYGHALREMDANNWREARRLLEQVHKAQTGFLETEKLLIKVDDEVLKVERKREQNDEINTLYEQAHGLLRSKKWRNALEKLEQIRKLDEHFPDADKIAEKAQRELLREEQEAERQNKLAAIYAEAVRLLKEEKYQEALDKWQEVKATDPKYPDRQWVQRTARRNLADTVQSKVKLPPQFSVQKIRIEWLVLLAAIGFGIARLVQQNLGLLFRVDIPDGLDWGIRGVLQGLIVALVLMRVERIGEWKAPLTFAVCWAIVYPMARIMFLELSVPMAFEIFYSLAPVLSLILFSMWTRRKIYWSTIALIFAGWIMAWVIGGNAAEYLSPVFNGASNRWVVSDLLAGAVGLWITVDLWKPRSGEKTLDETSNVNAGLTSGSASLLLLAFLSIVIFHASWEAFFDWLHIWDAEIVTIPQFISLFVLGGFYGAVVAFSLKRTLSDWRPYLSLIVIAGWAFGFGVAILALRANLEFDAVLMTISGLSMAGAVKLGKPSISSIKVGLIFVFWWMAKMYGAMLGNCLKANLGTDYVWCFADAISILLGLMATLGVYEFGSYRSLKTVFIASIGFAAGNFLATVLSELLSRFPQIGEPIGLALWGLIAGIIFESNSRNLKRMLITGGLCAIGLVIGNFSASLFLPRYINLRNLLWGAGLGIALGLPTRRISVISLIAILGSAMFTITSIYMSTINTGSLWESTVRGAWIGLVLGFGYAYATKEGTGVGKPNGLNTL